MLLIGAAGAGKQRLLAGSDFVSWPFEPVWSCWELTSPGALPVQSSEQLAWAGGPLLRRAHAVLLLLDGGRAIATATWQ